MAWSQIVEALLLLAGALVLLGAWFAARYRDRRATAALRHSEERFRHLTSLSADWFWETDAQHRVNWMSGGSAVAELFGAEMVHGRKLWEIAGVLVEPRGLVEHLERLEALDAQMPFLDFVITRSDAAGLRAHHITGKPRYDQAGRFIGYRGVGQDITRRRRAERTLAETKERLELATEVGNLAVWDLDVGTDQLHMGGGWKRTLGERRFERSAEMLEQVVHPADRSLVRARFLEVLKAAGQSLGTEFRMQTASGEWRWVQCSGRVTQRDGEGRALRMTGTMVEIDARKRAEQALRDAEERYRALVDLSPNGVLVTANGIVEYANSAAVQMLGATMPQELLGLHRDQLVQPEYLAKVHDRARFLESGPGASRFEERRLRRLDGRDIVVETAGVSYLERGRLVVQSVMRDVSEQRQAREAIAEREKRFRDVLEASGEYVWETDLTWRYTFLSERVEAVLGFLRHEMIGRTPREFMPLGESRAVEAWFAKTVAGGKVFHGLEHRSITKAGRLIWQQVSGVPVHDADGRLVGYRGTGADITARKLAEERIQYLATRDALTGLPNRALFADRASQAILAAARNRGSLAILYMDLDRFGLVNDSLGHAAGDALLRAVAERLSGTLRKDDTLARLGGDEFVLLWNGMKDSKDAAALAQRALTILSRPFTVEGRSLSVSASIGISVYPGDGRDFAELLRNADAARGHAKETGRNGFRFFSPELNARAVARLSMENGLRNALARNELLLHWQPVVRCGSPGAPGGELVGAEALVRWRHPEQGLLMPDAFVPVAEECGLIRPLGFWTIERALSQAGAWRRAARTAAARDLWFALNVSAHELSQGDAYVERLAAALKANDLPGSCVELEVTERVLMSHLGENVETLRRIGRLGVRVAIDDFGTGYSSLAYLRRLPIDKLKIDRSFLRELDANPQDATIVQTISAMARALGLKVAAEGVENEAQLARMRMLGCDEWQGHHYSLPLDAEAFERLVAREQSLRAAG